MSPIGVPPVVTAESAPFWQEAAEGRLTVEQCTDCGAHVFPPRGMCARCGSRDLTLWRVEGPGRVHSFTVNYNPWLPGMEVPFGLVLVEFDSCPGFRVLGRLGPGDPNALAIGDAVAIGIQPGPRGLSIPTFTRAETAL